MQTIENLYQNLADSIADVIAHPECPETLYSSLSQWVSDFASDLASAASPEDEAIQIRAELPQLCRIASRKREGQEVRKHSPASC